MWTEEHRRIYRRAGDGYPSDLRAAELGGAAGAVDPEASPGGRPRKTDMRPAMNAIATDFENLAETLAPFVTLVSIQLALRQLTKA
jgi:hypothetical protein